MASTYVNDLRLNELATGDASGTWGTITNTNLELIAEAFSFGTEGITTNADTHTSTIADGATDPVRSMYVKYTGTLDSACTITIAPNTVSKLWFIENGTSGSQNIIISQGTGANVTIPAGDTKVVYSDGAGSGAAVVDAFASLSTVDLKVQDDLTVTDDASVGGDLLVSGEVQTANIGFTDGDNAITIADGGGITAANGITSTAAANSFGATSFNDANITNVGDIALDSLSADGSSISIASPVVINGTTPTLTIGDAGAEDTKIVFDGNAQDYYIGLDDSADDLIIGKGSTVGTTPGIVIDENLNVGIRTTSLNAVLQTDPESGNFSSTYNNYDGVGLFIRGNGTSGNGNYGPALVFGSCDSDTANQENKHCAISIVQTDTDPNQTGLAFWTHPSNTSTDALSESVRIDAAGKLGVGTTNPSFAVDINADNGDQLRLDNDGDRFTQITMANNGTTKANFNFDNTDSLAEIFAVSGAGLKLSTGGSERVRITSGGDFLINKTNAAGSVEGFEFENNVCRITKSGGTPLLLNRLSTDGVILDLRKNTSIVGSISTNANSLPSDKNFKRDISDLDLGLNLISKLKPSQYNYKIDDEGSPKMFGLIAQDLEQSLSEVGIEKNSTWLLQHEPKDDENESDYSLDYLKLTPVLIKAIQEQQTQIEALQSEINTLKGG
mgnify:CR=1 FL=1